MFFKQVALTYHWKYFHNVFFFNFADSKYIVLYQVLSFPLVLMAFKNNWSISVASSLPHCQSGTMFFPRIIKKKIHLFCFKGTIAQCQRKRVVSSLIIQQKDPDTQILSPTTDIFCFLSICEAVSHCFLYILIHKVIFFYKTG